MRKTLTQKQIRALVKDADRYTRLLCVHAAGHRCEKCGSTYNLEHHHPVSRGYHWLIRLHDLNRVCLCRDCHVWAHSHYDLFLMWFDGYDRKRHYFAIDRHPPVYNQHDPTARRNELKAQWARIDDDA